MTNAEIAQIMSWSTEQDEYGFICHEYDILQTWNEQPDYNKFMLSKVMQQHMVDDGWQIHIIQSGVAFRCECFKEFKTYTSEYFNTEPAAIVALFGKIYGGE